jgi:hypothetical protein
VNAHDAEAAAISGTKSSACTACHGTNVLDVSAGSQHIAGEHRNCLCHAYGEATSLKECVDCHSDAYAPHGFIDGVSHTGAGYPSASGHNTTSLGTVGAYTMWNGSQGPLVKDSLESTITTAWPLPDQNVFWAAGDPSAPASATTGLSYASVVKCEDCHTGLKAYEIAGPHGASTPANWGIDPKFSGSFDTAFLWGSGDASITVNPATGKGVYDPTRSNPTTFTTKSGIAQYVPTMVGGVTGEELADWDLASGAAHVETGTVICVKCHDLYNAGAGDLGWSNYGHEHHADRPVKFGTYTVGNGGAMATRTVSAETTTAAVAMVPGATQYTTVIAASLGREGAGACRDCHIAVPHGWKRPRLIVYSSDGLPYNAGPSVYEGESLTATSGVTIGSGQMNGLSSIKAPTITVNPVNGTGSYNNWSTSQCSACGHHAGTDLSAGAWK